MILAKMFPDLSHVCSRNCTIIHTISLPRSPVHYKYIGCRNHNYRLCLNYPTILKSTLQITHRFMVLAKMFPDPSHVSSKNHTIIHTISLPIGRQNTLQTCSLQVCTKVITVNPVQTGLATCNRDRSRFITI